MSEPSAVLDRARTVVDEVLFPRALETDGADRVPRENLDALAEAGFYGVFAPEEIGGLNVEFPTVTAAIETLASGCLATTLVWIQHLGLLGGLLGDAPQHLKDEWLVPLARGERRSGIALTGLRPGPPALRARVDGDGWILDGEAPWVSGWGMIDALQLVARGPDDESVVWILFDATNQPGLTVTRQHLVGADASCTVQLSFDGLRIPGERVLKTGPRVDPNNPLTGALRVNASLPLGVAARSCRLIGPSRLDDELAQIREALDAGADEEAAAAARGAASAFAVKAAAALAVHTGSASVGADHHAQRLAREASLLLVFGTRPGIRANLLERLGVA